MRLFVRSVVVVPSGGRMESQQGVHDPGHFGNYWHWILWGRRRFSCYRDGVGLESPFFLMTAERVVHNASWVTSCTLRHKFKRRFVFFCVVFFLPTEIHATFGLARILRFVHGVRRLGLFSRSIDWNGILSNMQILNEIQITLQIRLQVFECTIDFRLFSLSRAL